MKFHLPSFLLGVALGGVAGMASKQLRPLVLELATAAYRIGDAIAARAIMKREDLEDLLAEARARARAASPNGGGRPQA